MREIRVKRTCTSHFIGELVLELMVFSDDIVAYCEAD
ncbi:hypothetical protein DIKCMJMK_04212 [Shewanella oneidensis]|nr:hypothetical protein [Shewanella oneidensis]